MTHILLAGLVLVASLYVIFRPGRRAKGFVLRDVLVIDGDTIFSNGKKYRLHGIDAPEMDQAGGPDARDALKRMVGRREIRVEPMNTDRYGRTVARIHAADGDVCEAMVLTGYARASFHRDYVSAERKARRERAGLWARGGIADPAAHRKRKTR